MPYDVEGYLQSKGVNLKRAGANQAHFACPFCGEDPGKRGRLYVNIDPDVEPPGLFTCFLCNTRGAINKLRKHYGDKPLDSDSAPVETHSQVHQEIFQQAAIYYHELLGEHIDALRYLRDERGLSIETMQKHELGWADGTLASHFRKIGVSLKDAEATGLVDGNGRDFLRDCITIPYHIAGNVVQIRGKQIGAKYLTPPGQKARLYNADCTWTADQIIVTEGECFPPDAEVLTPLGWVPFGKYQGEPVVQCDEQFNLTLVPPVAFVRKEFDGELVEYSNAQRFYSLTTPDHKIPSFWVTPTQKLLKWAKVRAVEPQPENRRIARTGILDGHGVQLSDDQLRLLLAVSADGTIDIRKNTGPRKAKTERYVRFGLRKQRKIERLRDLLVRLRINFSDGALHQGTYRSICFSLPDGWDFVQKLLPWDLMIDLSIAQREILLDEMRYWDGNSVPNRDQTEFSSAVPHNAMWMQTLAHTCGRTSTIIKRSNQYGDWEKVSILHSKSSTSWQSLRTNNKQPYSGNVYCVQVPSGMLLVRQNGCISVSGNCDALVLEQLGYAAVGVPGATSWQDSWNGYFSEARKVFICFDPDTAGEAGAERVARAIGPKARIVRMPETGPDGKKNDPSEWIVNKGHSKDDFQMLLIKAKGGHLLSVDDAYAEWSEVQSGLGIRFGFDLLDNKILPGLMPSQIAILLAKSGTGKTIAALNMFHRMCLIQPGLQILFISLEQTRGDWFERARRIHRFYNLKDRDEDVLDFFRPRLMMVDKNRISEEEMVACIEQYEFEAGRKPDLVAVDYLGYWARSFKGEAYERTGAAVMALKAIAKEHRIAIFAPHQVSRNTKYGEEMDADAGRDAGTIEETADFVFTLWSEDNRSKITENEKSGVMKIKIAKSRHGGVGTLQQLQWAPLSLVLVPFGDPLVQQARDELVMAQSGDEFETAIYRHATGDMRVRIPIADYVSWKESLA